MRKNMKRIFSLLIILVLIACIGLLPVQATELELNYKTRDDFYWGINHHGSWYNCYPEEYLEERIHLIAKSGATMVRINGQLGTDMELIDQEVGLCNKYGLKIIMTIIPSRDMGLEFIELSFKSLAERYNGKNGRGFVDYIQAWNETDAELIKAKHGTGGPAGNTYNAYYTEPVDGYADLPEYTEYFKAAAKGIHEADSDTKFMINFCYKGWASILWYLENGVEIDAIGWDSYGQSKDVTESTTAFKEDCENLYNDVIKKYNVPVIICETNTTRSLIPDYNATHKLENYQTLFNIMEVAYSYDWMKGLVIYELLDEPNYSEAESNWGMVDCELGGIIGEEKPIYKELQRLWGGNENLKMLDRSEVNLEPYEKLKVDTTDDSHIGNDDITSSTPDTDISNTIIPEVQPDDFVSETENETEKQEVITMEPDVITKQMNVTRNTYKLPWLMIILCGVGMLLLAGGVVMTFVIIDKKKAKKNSLLE